MPNIAAPTCGWIEHEVFTAPDDRCVRLEPSEGELRFLADDDESCEGKACLFLHPGERGIVIGPVLGSDEGLSIRYDKTFGDCATLDPCPVE